jgi:FAD/FMN-containing dehydrogenase
MGHVAVTATAKAGPEPANEGRLSWGRFPRLPHAGVVPVRWRSDPPDLAALPGTILPHAYGRSYGDSCLNAGGILLDVRPLRRFIAFDEERGTLWCEAGVTLADILVLSVPHGWFLPVVPGTQTVSVGGAIANDIHGKNHHRAGSFGCHVTRLELLRSNGERCFCSPRENGDLFSATIGGLGLTGVILSAEIALKRITSSHIDMERIRFGALNEFFDLSEESDEDFEYTVAWVDCLARSRSLGRGIFLRGNHSAEPSVAGGGAARSERLRVPVDAPSRLLNPVTVQAFNAVYYRLPLRRRSRDRVPYQPFFFPLDSVADWNRLYGGAGFLQYQCVVPPDASREAMRDILHRVSRSREASFLAVLKNFGSQKSPGLLSFPRPGATLALDLPQRGERTFRLLDELDEIVRSAGGAVYPAKDARMSPRSFQRYFPNWRRFEQFTDPKFSSSFWRRVTQG